MIKFHCKMHCHMVTLKRRWLFVPSQILAGRGGTTHAKMAVEHFAANAKGSRDLTKLAAILPHQSPRLAWDFGLSAREPTNSAVNVRAPRNFGFPKPLPNL